MHLFRFKPALIALLFVWQTHFEPVRTHSHFRYQRTLLAAPYLLAHTPPVEACAILDADVFANAAPALKDLRLYSGTVEIPYSITVIEPQQQDSDEARILNPEARPGRVDFDLEMPRRPYTEVTLNLAARDFVATAIVSGSNSRSFKNAVPLGSFTLFDLTSQHLSRATTILLTESTFAFLHVELALHPASGGAASTAPLNVPSLVTAAVVPPSREAQSLYTAARPKVTMLQAGAASVATFEVPAKVPIERVSFTLPPGLKGDFSRRVKISARGIGDGPDAQDDPNGSDGFSSEDTTGTILSVHRSMAGHDLSAEDLSVPVAIGSNMQHPALIEIEVENSPGDALPLSVQLQMRQRRICFDAASVKGTLTLYYGDPSLDAPAYGGAPVQSAVAPRLLELGPETLNPAFAATPSSRRFVGQRPVLRWIALLGCVCIFALLVIRSTHKRRR